MNIELYFVNNRVKVMIYVLQISTFDLVNIGIRRVFRAKGMDLSLLGLVLIKKQEVINRKFFVNKISMIFLRIL